MSTSRDALGRFPASSSAACRHGFLHRPIVDELAVALQSWLRSVVPAWHPRQRSFRLQLDHDVDCLRRFAPHRALWAPRGGGRTLAASLLRLRPRRALRVVREIRNSRRSPRQGEAFQGIVRLLELARRHHHGACFYFMAADASKHDVGYDLGGELAQEALSLVRDAGMELAFHPGFESFDDPQRLARELQRFKEATGVSACGVRQHYLRLQVPRTWRTLAELDVPWDATLGFAEAPGFRAGTCHPYRPFDMHADEELPIEIRPLIAMDRSFMRRDYSVASPERALQTLVALAERCRQVGGTFRLLWHNTNVHGKWGRCYERFVEGLRYPLVARS